MPRKDRIDAAGAGWLIAFALLFAINQVVVKWTNQGLQPVFYAGVRSLLAIIPVVIWMRWRGIAVQIDQGTVASGVLIGIAFTTEFLFLFLALDFTTVVRSSILFYSMPIWLAHKPPMRRAVLSPWCPAHAAGRMNRFIGCAWKWNRPATTATGCWPCTPPPSTTCAFLAPLTRAARRWRPPC